MQDMTQGSIAGHLVRMSAPIALGMLFQTLYVLVDLYFVAQLGDAAIAGVSTAGNLQFIVMAATQVLGVGTMALIAQAIGRKDQADANLIFNQSLMLALIAGIVTLIGGYLLIGPYMRSVGADERTVEAGAEYLRWFFPGLALQFALIAMGAALRGTGIAKPTLLVQMVTVLLNALLAPILIAGWITHVPLGIAGAGLATSISVAVGVVLMWLYFHKLEKYVSFDAELFRRAHGGLETHPAHWPAARRRVRADVLLPRGDLLGHPPFRRRGAGRIRRRLARHAGDLPAGDGGRVRDGADRRAERRRRPSRARARDVPLVGDSRQHDHAGADAHLPAQTRVVRAFLHAGSGRARPSPRPSCTSSRGTSSRRASSSPARACSRRSATRCRR